MSGSVRDKIRSKTFLSAGDVPRIPAVPRAGCRLCAPIRLTRYTFLLISGQSGPLRSSETYRLGTRWLRVYITQVSLAARETDIFTDYHTASARRA